MFEGLRSSFVASLCLTIHFELTSDTVAITSNNRWSEF